MSDEEIQNAASALIDWFHSQGISPFDSIVVIASVLGYIHATVEELAKEAK